MAVPVASVFVHDQLANESRVLVEPLHLTDRGKLSTLVWVLAREIPVDCVHIPPLGCEKEDGPGDDPEEVVFD